MMLLLQEWKPLILAKIIGTVINLMDILLIHATKFVTEVNTKTWHYIKEDNVFALILLPKQTL